MTTPSYYDIFSHKWYDISKILNKLQAFFWLIFKLKQCTPLKLCFIHTHHMIVAWNSEYLWFFSTQLDWWPEEHNILRKKPCHVTILSPWPFVFNWSRAFKNKSKSENNIRINKHDHNLCNLYSCTVVLRICSLI